MNYEDWNQYFIQKFFFDSERDSIIRLNVSQDWFDAIPARDGMGGYADFLKAIRAASEQKPLYDTLLEMLVHQRKYRDTTPQYVAYLVFLCLPWTCSTRGYWDILKEMAEDCDIQLGRLPQINCRFSKLLNTGSDGDLLSLLRNWWNRLAPEQGQFVYCHLYDDSDDKVSLLRSQVWPTDADLDWMPEILFCHTDQDVELSEEQLIQYCSQRENIQQALPSFKNLFLSQDPIAQLVKKDALEQIYESYEEWVDEGRYLESSEPRQGERLRQVDGCLRRKRKTPPHIWLRLKRKGDHWDKSLFVRASEFQTEETPPIMTRSIEIGAHQYRCQLGRLKSGNFLLKDRDEVWNALAGLGKFFSGCDPDRSHLCGDFTFSCSWAYFMSPCSTGTFVQQDFPTQDQDFWLLYHRENEKCDSLGNNDVRTLPPHVIDSEWRLKQLPASYASRAILLAYGDIPKQTGLTVRLTGGIKARLGKHRYLRDFLPNIEAYLPEKHSVMIRDEYGNSYDPALILHEIALDSDGEETPILQNNGELYLTRVFSISLPAEFSASGLRFQFQIGGMNYGREQRVKLTSSRQQIEIMATHALDRFGNVVPREDGMAYWPDAEVVSPEPRPQFLPATSRKTEIDTHSSYWKFIGQLAQAQGKSGIPGKEFWNIVCSNFHYVAGWKQQVQFLSSLGILDIRTNDFGIWTKFYLNPPALCLLPTTNEKGQYQAVLSGAFTADHIAKLNDCREKQSDFALVLSEQRHSMDNISPMLPPHVLLMADSTETFRNIARTCGDLDWGGIPAWGFLHQSVSVEEWLEDRQGYIRDGNPRNEDITGWYDLLGYKTQMRTDDDHLENPLVACPALFTRCMCTRPCPSIPKFDVHDLVNRARNVSVYVKDIPWGRWVSYLLDGDFQHLRFRIAYKPSSGIMVFPEKLMPPRVLARALTLCSGRIPQKMGAQPYDQCQSRQTLYGLSVKPYDGTCLWFMGVPREIAKCVAMKLHCELKDW